MITFIFLSRLYFYYLAKTVFICEFSQEVFCFFRIDIKKLLIIWDELKEKPPVSYILLFPK